MHKVWKARQARNTDLHQLVKVVHVVVYAHDVPTGALLKFSHVKGNCTHFSLAVGSDKMLHVKAEHSAFKTELGSNDKSD